MEMYNCSGSVMLSLSTYSLVSLPTRKRVFVFYYQKHIAVATSGDAYTILRERGVKIVSVLDYLPTSPATH